MGFNIFWLFENLATTIKGAPKNLNYDKKIETSQSILIYVYVWSNSQNFESIAIPFYYFYRMTVFFLDKGAQINHLKQSRKYIFLMHNTRAERAFYTIIQDDFRFSLWCKDVS